MISLLDHFVKRVDRPARLTGRAPWRPCGLWSTSGSASGTPRGHQLLPRQPAWVARGRAPLTLAFGGWPDVSELGHCVTQARRLPWSRTEGEPWHDQRSQGVSALVRGAVGGPPVRIRVRAPRAEPRRTPLPTLIDHARRTIRPRHATPALKQLLAQYGDRLICVRYRYDARGAPRRRTTNPHPTVGARGRAARISMQMPGATSR